MTPDKIISLAVAKHLKSCSAPQLLKLAGFLLHTIGQGTVNHVYKGVAWCGIFKAAVSYFALLLSFIVSIAGKGKEKQAFKLLCVQAMIAIAHFYSTPLQFASLDAPLQRGAANAG